MVRAITMLSSRLTQQSGIMTEPSHDVAFDCIVHRLRKGIGYYVKWMAVVHKLDRGVFVLSTGLFCAHAAGMDVMGGQ